MDRITLQVHTLTQFLCRFEAVVGDSVSRVDERLSQVERKLAYLENRVCPHKLHNTKII